MGKSRLFNRLVGKRISIVHDRPGVTRDVVVADSPDGFVLMDTGGIGMFPEMTPKEIQDAMEEQGQLLLFKRRIYFSSLWMVAKDYFFGCRVSSRSKNFESWERPVLIVKMDEEEKLFIF